MLALENEVDQKLAKSLTAETTDLIPFLPYLLQDLWELGSEPKDIISLIKKNIPISTNTIMLDLACGKGAVCVKIAQELNINMKGIDIVPEFIEFAEQKSIEYRVSSLCQFAVGDINKATSVEENYDCVILGAVGDVLGTPQETMMKLKRVIKSNGYIIIDEAYLNSEDNIDIKHQNSDYLTYEQWVKIFDEAGLTIVNSIINDNIDSINDFNTRSIIARANELMKQYPQQKKLFEEYIQSQQNECEDLENSLVGITWLLQSK